MLSLFLRSTEHAMVLSLLNQLWEQHGLDDEAFYKVLLSRFPYGESDPFSGKRLEDHCYFLKEMIGQVAPHHQVYLVLDGLDE